MLSYETKLKLAEFLLVFSEQEQQIETVRQLLCEQPTFEPYAAFRRIDRERTGFITPKDIQNFLEDHSASHSSKFCDALVGRYSSQTSLELDYKDFLRIVLPQNNSKLRMITTQRPNYDVQANEFLPRNVEQSLVEVFDRELMLLLSNDNLKHTLVNRYDYNNLDAFAAIDKLQTEKIDYDNLKLFFKEMKIFPNQNDLVNILKRIDKNDDGLLSYDEFSEALRIIEPYLANTVKASPTKYFRPQSHTPTRKSNAFNAVSTAKKWQLPPPGISEKKLTTQKENIKDIIEFYTSPQRVNHSKRKKSPISEVKASLIQRVSPQSNQRGIPVSDSKTFQTHRRAGTSANAEIYKEVFKRIASPSKNQASDQAQQIGLKSISPFTETTLNNPNTSTKYYGAEHVKNSPFNLELSPIGKDFQQKDTVTTIRHLVRQKTPTTKTSRLETNYSATKEKPRSSLIKPVRIDMSQTSTSAKENQILTHYLKQLIYMDKDVEVAKQDLALRPDFNLLDFFRVFDVEGRGNITKAELQRGLEKFGISANHTEINLFVRRYDRDNDGRLKFSEFCDALSPKLSEYSVLLNKRSLLNGSLSLSIRELFSSETQKGICHILRLHLDNEMAVESLRHKLQTSGDLDPKRAFNALDKNLNGYITLDELRAFFDSQEAFVVEKDLVLLLNHLDLNKDGKITFSELLQEFTPAK